MFKRKLRKNVVLTMPGGFPEYPLQTRCTMVDFNLTQECLTKHFMDIVFECEMPAKRQEYLLICDR